MSEDQEKKDEENVAGTYSPDDTEKATIAKWNKRFTQAERFREPFQAKFLRMWKLYRAYRDKTNYAYNTRLMPPIGFEIVETIKPRLSASRMTTRIFPVDKSDVGSGAIEDWDSLIAYDFDIMGLDDKKVDWIDSMLKYGNGYAHLYWRDAEDGGDPAMDILDNWLLYFDPQASNRLKDSEWEIKQVFKTKQKIEKEESKRNEREEEEEVGEDEEGDDIEERENEDGTTKRVRVKKVHGVYKNLQYVKNQAISDDPRTERVQIESLKAGQIYTGDLESDDTQTRSTEAEHETKAVEIWECYDHNTDEIVTIMNREVLVREEDSPYKDINEGRLIIDLPCIRLPWSAYAMGIMEPVETIIHEIADSRNQAMDSIVFNLDPIKKIRKDSGLTSDDLVSRPGALWELENADDVVTERGTGPDNSWVEKDNLLRREIQTSLALSEYVRGMPSSPQEPSSKVEILLTQTQIRFSQMVRQLEVAMTDMVNILIQMNQKFLPEEKTYRLLGDDIDFKDFTSDSKQVKVDARVEIEPKQEKGPEKRKAEALELYKLFISEDLPEEGDEESMRQWKSKKRELQKMILDEYDKSQYEDVLLGLEKMEEAEQNSATGDENNVVEGGDEAVIPTRSNREPIPLVEADTPQIPQGAPQAPQGFLQRLLGRLRG